jgi:hypothetical protein
MTNLTDLKNKKILFLGIGFYDYESTIIEELRKMDVLAIYYNVSPKLPVKVLGRIQLLKKKIYDIFLMNFLKHNIIQFDFIFVIKGEYIKQSHCLYLKENQKNAIFILYLWDSITRIEGINNILHYFDKILSFDTEDVRKFGFIFRPLFFRKEILVNSSNEKKYDISFVGWVHSDRIKLINDFRLLLLEKGYKLYFYAYIGKIEKLLLLISGKIKKSDIFLCTKPLDFIDYCQILSMSRCILDIHHPKQSGLTMRSIEALAAGCFLITTNHHITEYTDISSASYFLLDRNLSNISSLDINNITNKVFIKSTEYYSLEYFIRDIFTIE